MKAYKLVRELLVKEERKELILLFFGSVIMGLLETVGIASVVPFMAVASDPGLVDNNQYLSSIYVFTSVNSVNSFVVVLGFLLMILMFFSNAFNAYMVWRITKFSHLQGYRISKRLFLKYLSRQYVYFLDKNSADIGKNMLTEVDRVVTGVVLPLLGMSSKFVSMLFIIVMLLVFDPMLAIIMILVLTLIYSILYMAIRKKITQMGAESTTLIGMRYRVVFEAISGIKDVIMKNISGEMLKRYSEPSLKYAKYSAYGNALSELPRYALEIIIFGGMVMLTVSLLMNEQDSSFIAVLSLYAMAGYRLMPSAQLIFRAFSTIRYNTPVLEKIINELNDKYVLIENEVEAADGVQFRDEIKLDKIEYTYPGSRDKVLNNLSIEIKSRSAIGIAGVSGAGKTTLIDILLGLISPDKGSLKVDGVEITASNICAWRKSIGYVPQDVFVADDTIANNIAFGIPSNEIVESNIEFSASLSNLDSFIASLAEGYETIIGERGSKMSGGQRQRLGIARALYSNPDIIVFDEATSALDGITESEIIDSLHNLRHKKTIVMIAHRLTTLKECDIIYFLKDGVVSDSGTYQELMEHNSLFKDMSGS